MKVVLTGSREWCDHTVPRQILRRLHLAGVERVAHGDGRGFDKVCDSVAREVGFRDEQIGKHPADWDGEGKAAGYLRNLSMLRKEDPTLVVGAPLADSKGTWHTIAWAQCPRLIFIDGCRDAIKLFSDDLLAHGCGMNWSRSEFVTNYVDDRIRDQVMRARGSLDYPAYATIPRRDRPWWVLVLPKHGGDVESLPIIEALLR